MSLLDLVKFCESYNRVKIGKSHCSNTAKSKILVTPGSNILIANDFPISEIQNHPLDLIVIIIIEIAYTEKSRSLNDKCIDGQRWSTRSATN